MERDMLSIAKLRLLTTDFRVCALRSASDKESSVPRETTITVAKMVTDTSTSTRVKPFCISASYGANRYLARKVNGYAARGGRLGVGAHLHVRSGVGRAAALGADAGLRVGGDAYVCGRALKHNVERLYGAVKGARAGKRRSGTEVAYRIATAELKGSDRLVCVETAVGVEVHKKRVAAGGGSGKVYAVTLAEHTAACGALAGGGAISLRLPQGERHAVGEGAQKGRAVEL